METLTYREALQVGLWLLWRVLLSVFGVVFIMDALFLWLMPELVRSNPPLWASVVPVTIAVVFTLVVVMPVLAMRLLMKRFLSFHLVAVHHL
jgi:hypothetical protein